MSNIAQLLQRKDIQIISNQRDHDKLWKSLEQLHPKLVHHFNTKDQSHTQLLDKQIILLSKLLDRETNEKKASRGGNNVSENGKKALMASMKKILPQQVFDQLQQKFIIPYHLKSQKENMTIYFMILTLFVHDRKIERSVVEKLREDIFTKIGKYISNSQAKLDLEEDRKDFHLKNIQEFEKIKSLDLDFFKERSFKEMSKEIEKMYLKKKSQFHKAEQKMKNIIRQFPSLLNTFPDLKEQESLSKEQHSETTQKLDQ